MKYIIIDTMNMFFRCRHQAMKGSDSWSKVGFAIHLTLTSAAKEFREHNGDHVVFALESQGSWRKKFYPAYKRQRSEARAELTEEAREEEALFFEAYDSLVEFLDKRTNCTVLQAETAEGDDLIAFWTQAHPEDEHVIVSSDTDFHQLIAPNVSQYNAVSKRLYTTDGVFDDKGQPVVDKKTKAVMEAIEPAYELFKKCIRGDKGDNIFSAFPGAREKGTKNKVGIREAFEDRTTQGYNWNNFMLQRWIDHHEKEHKVLEDYERNVKLVDLTQQPEVVRNAMAVAVANAYAKPSAKMVGAHLLKFCGKWELNRIADYPDSYAEFMNAGLPDYE